METLSVKRHCVLGTEAVCFHRGEGAASALDAQLPVLGSSHLQHLIPPHLPGHISSVSMAASAN